MKGKQKTGGQFSRVLSSRRKNQGGERRGKNSEKESGSIGFRGVRVRGGKTSGGERRGKEREKESTGTGFMGFRVRDVKKKSGEEKHERKAEIKRGRGSWGSPLEAKKHSQGEEGNGKIKERGKEARGQVCGCSAFEMERIPGGERKERKGETHNGRTASWGPRPRR